ncbi:MAG: class II aldolase/adducin family protein [Thermoplasmata archaeon]|nr:class II aldolase/adducin family protein [Thermoplasmata archaeon]
MDETEARRALIETCARLYDRKLTVSAGGNMSVRCGDCVLITPSGRNKGLLKPEDLVKVAMDGTVISGPKPSIETRFHLALYNANPSTNAVVHVHPLYGVALTVNGRKLRCNLTPEGALLLGKVATIPYITPGTEELVEAVRANASSQVMIMDRHGTLAQGSTLEEAYNRVEELEFQARLQMLCPDAEDLPDSELAKLGVLRWRYW